MIKTFRKVIGSTLVSMLLLTTPMASVGHAHPAMIKKMLAAHALWLGTHGLAGKRANFREMDLSSHNMIHVELAFAELRISNLSDIDLRWANLCNAILSGSNFSGADLGEADLSGATLTNAYLNGTDLTGANLKGASLAMADLSGALLRFADLTNADLSGADLREVDLTGAILNGTKLQSARRLTIPMLSKAKTLRGSNLDPQLKRTLQDLAPHLFEPSE
ncbi:MAG TPA: pentapeptide repeat-containing protein [Nitrospirales bacterium]|jgi:hypothetical protein|nr:pentapeptide repeat-containing protein [Nitrospirales bacterium]HIB53936.1 pentapeptide repeat-containing protein [Nitrospirales bacterium]HIN33485.1 pentapeptide repeat-containing protein [Nitrospirales bacterium]